MQLQQQQRAANGTFYAGVDKPAKKACVCVMFECTEVGLAGYGQNSGCQHGREAKNVPMRWRFRAALKGSVLQQATYNGKT